MEDNENKVEAQVDKKNWSTHVSKPIVMNQKRFDLPSSMVKVKNSSLVQTQIVYDRHMQSHELLPGQMKVLEMVDDEVAHFLNRRGFGHPVHIEGEAENVRTKDNREVDPREITNANRRGEEGYNTDRGDTLRGDTQGDSNKQKREKAVKEAARLFAKEKLFDKKAEYKNYESNDLMAEKPFGDEKQVVEKPKFESFEKPSNDAC